MVSAHDGLLYLYYDLRIGRGSPRLVWLLVAATLTVLALVFALTGDRAVFLMTGMPLAIGVGMTPFALQAGLRDVVAWMEGLPSFVCADPDEIEEWVKSWRVGMRTAAQFRSAGVVFIVWALLAYLGGSFFDGLSVAEVSALAVIIIFAAFTGGIGIWSLVFVARMVFAAGRFEVVVDNHKFGVLSTGGMLTRIYVLGASVWFVITVSAAWNFESTWKTLLAIAFPNALIILGSFVLSQFPLHRAMLDYKRSEALRLQGLIRDALAASLDDLGTDGRSRVDFLQKQLDKTLALPEWPFGWKALTSVAISWLASTIVPIASQMVIHAATRV